MKIIECVQGTSEWYAARMGKATSSNFSKIMTPKKMELSASWFPYACLVLAEKVLRQTLTSLDHIDHIASAKLMEPQAAMAYELEYGVELRTVGFCTTDDGRFGASPDRLSKDLKMGLEIKCPAPQTHLQYFYNGFGDDYQIQAQGQCFVAELEYVDRYSYCPGLPSVKDRTYRNDPYIKVLAARLNEFHDKMLELENRLLASGFYEQTGGRILDPYEAYMRQQKELEDSKEHPDSVMAG